MTADYENAYISSDISKGAKTFFYLGIYPRAAQGNFDSTKLPLQRWIFQPCTYVLFKGQLVLG
jgi:hypothetical protein